MIQRFSASVAARHMACHASANLELAIPNWVHPEEKKTGAASRGTAMHELLDPIMRLKASEVQQFSELLTYVAELRATRRFNVLVEESVTAEWLDTKPGTTADLVLFTQDEMHIVDYKWGKMPVEVTGNQQLLYYAACYAPLAPKAKGVTLHILQPPIHKYESWFADTTVIGQFMADARAAEAAIQAGDTTFGPSDSCTFCPANPHSRGEKGRPLCPAMMKMLYPDKTDEDEILSM
jgi:Protein of unknown function (DUF2800)